MILCFFCFLPPHHHHFVHHWGCSSCRYGAAPRRCPALALCIGLRGENVVFASCLPPGGWGGGGASAPLIQNSQIISNSPAIGVRLCSAELDLVLPTSDAQRCFTPISLSPLWPGLHPAALSHQELLLGFCPLYAALVFSLRVVQDYVAECRNAVFREALRQRVEFSQIPHLYLLIPSQSAP